MALRSRLIIVVPCLALSAAGAARAGPAIDPTLALAGVSGPATAAVAAAFADQRLARTLRLLSDLHDFDGPPRTSFVGVDRTGGYARYGAAVAVPTAGARDDALGFRQGPSSGVAGAVVGRQGLYLQAVAGRGKLSEAPAFGPAARGRSMGRTLSGDVQLGYAFDLGGVAVGPFVDLLYADIKLNPFVERGPSIGVGPGARYRRAEGALGVEAAGTGRVRPSVRVSYTAVQERGDRSTALAIGLRPSAVQSLFPPALDGGFVSADAGLESQWRGFSWRASVGARGAARQSSSQISLGMLRAF